MTQFPATTILNIPVLSITKRQLLDSLHDGILFTPNLDHLVKLQTDKAFFEAYKNADWIVCDSRILLTCSRLLPEALPEAIPGSTFFSDYYLHHADDPDCHIFLLGAREGVAAEAARRINARVGREIVTGTYSPPFGFEKDPAEIDRIASIVNSSGANVCLVGLGAPKQELFITRHRHLMPGIRLWMALGATIDFEAGNIRRAPQWVRKICMEWFFRFLCEPRRMFRRYFIDDTRFFYHFARQLAGKYRSPF
ncbi:MAG: WecB/TagA/CpsF family glycosyltransferase [Duncaniella sp.]|nr:WecB/TagA/CpsF family glycosyltransferase [Duncaniella sp.]MDE6465569.1 WecB/TagA/CpsF family glycosyltransferase [Duncaniella sp.]MDE6572823.1 WecB/TagA/CpsF family glycosyltransferase [Duncaniella sp.]